MDEKQVVTNQQVSIADTQNKKLNSNLQNNTINEKNLENQQTSDMNNYKKRPILTNTKSSLSVSSSDEEMIEDRALLNDGIVPSSIPLEALAGPALILPSNDIDENTLKEENFDWNGKDEEDEDHDLKNEDKNKGSLTQNSLFICLGKNSIQIAWICIILFALIFIAIDISIFLIYQQRNGVSITSYNLELWFTWLAFMWTISFLSQIFVEVIPWVIKKSVSLIKPHSIEVLKMRLSYYKALRLYIKLLVISAWNWGSWALIKSQLALPVIGQDEYGFNVYESRPKYVDIFNSIFECLFFACLFIFIEKFILQLIVTSFHKKAYGDRIKENDKALRILDKLKATKKKNPQEYLLKKIRRKNNKMPVNYENSDSNNIKNTYYSQHHLPLSTPPITQNTKSIMTTNTNNNPSNPTENKSTVKFPTQNIETLIAIPPIEDRNNNSNKQDDLDKIEKQQLSQQTVDMKKDTNIINRLTNKIKKKKPTTSGTSTPNSSNEDSGDEALQQQQQQQKSSIKGDSTLFSDDSKSFFSSSGFSSTTGKFFKGGYNKFLSNNQNPNTNQSSSHAKFLAKKIFNNLVGYTNQRSTVAEADFYPFFNTTTDARYAFDLFDKDGNGDLTKSELRSGCVRIYRERKNLTRSMRDLSQASGKLDTILLVVFTVIWAIIVCAAFGVNVGTDLMPLWSAFVAASFIFGTSAKDAFEAIIFVFVTHPFDAGDRVFIGTDNWVVQNVGLLVTTFIKWDGSIVYAKNSVLSTQYIINVRRSGRTGETIELQISFSTPSWKIKQLEKHMIDWSNQFPKLYTPNYTCANVLSMKNQNMISVSFYFEHTQNWQDPGGRWLRHNNFMYELKEECERLEITYVMPIQPFTKGNDNDAPPESYNMGDKSSYGLDGMARRRRPYEAEDDDNFTNRPIGADNSHGHSGAVSDNSGAMAGAAATMMFASTM